MVLSWIIIRRQNLPFTMSRRDIGFHREILFFLQTGVPIAFVMLVPSSLMQSMSAFVGQNVGAGREDRARKAMYTGMAIGAFIGIFIFAVSFFRGDVPSALFTSNPEYIAKSAEYLRGFSPEAILTCVVFSFIGFFNGHGRTMPVMFQGITASF